MTAAKSAVFLGSKALGFNVFNGLYAATPDCRWTVIHPDDKTDSRSVLHQFSSLAQEKNLDFRIAPSGAAARQIVMDRQPDIGFVCGWYWLIDAATIDCVAGGLWGIHNSLLPMYRGGAPLVWSIINGDPVVGSTVFRISEGMDDGPVLHQVRVPLREDQDVSDALMLIDDKLTSELPQKWAALLSGKAVLTTQNELDATYCGQRMEEDGCIDWRSASSTVHNFVRAQAPPYPGAFSYLNGTKVTFLRTRSCQEIYFGTPGQVLRRKESSILVSCGQNSAIEVLQVSVAGNTRDPSQVVTSIRDRFSSTPR